MPIDYERYQELTPLVDNVGQIITVQHINPLQDLLMFLQKARYAMQDVDFKQLALFVLEHHPVVNSMVLDLLTDETRIAVMHNTAYSPIERGIICIPPEIPAEMIVEFTPFSSSDGCDIEEILLLAQDYLPEGTSIEYQISSDGQLWEDIVINIGEITTLPTPGPEATLRAKILPNETTGESPRLDAIAFLYRNQLIEPDLT